MRILKIINIIKSPRRIAVKLLRCTAQVWPDKLYLQILYYLEMGQKLNLKNPKTFNEKLQWLKLYNRKPEYTMMVDKYSVKQYVANIIGEEYIIKTLGVWNKASEIDWDSLPHQFVLKTTHGGGNMGVIIVKDKSIINKDAIVNSLDKAMKIDLYEKSKEWPYKNVKKRIIAEEFLEDIVTEELRDYKFFCFDGVVEALFIATDRQTRVEPYFNFFDADFNSLELKQGHPRNEILPAKPITFEKMKELATSLSVGIPHVRVDLYEVNGRIYFGELTLFHFAGIVPFEPNSWDYKLGDSLILPEKIV